MTFAVFGRPVKSFLPYADTYAPGYLYVAVKYLIMLACIVQSITGHLNHGAAAKVFDRMDWIKKDLQNIARRSRKLYRLSKSCYAALIQIEAKNLINSIIQKKVD